MSYEILANNVIRVTASDGCSHNPSNTTVTEEPDTSMNYYHYLPIEEKKNHDWRKRVGQKLAIRLKAYGVELDPDTAVLENWPSGYELYEHRTRKDSTQKIRTDVYLFGRHRFRSANEVEPHIFWLITDKTLPCQCKYCTKSRVVPNNNTITGSSESSIVKKTEPATLKTESSTSLQFKRYFAFRTGELVWVDLKDIGDATFIPMVRWNDGKMRYWPSIIWTRDRHTDVKPGVPVVLHYHVKLLRIPTCRRLKETSLRPWLSHIAMITPEDTSPSRNNVTDLILNQDYISAFAIALNAARKYTESYAVESPYRYRETEYRLLSISDIKEKQRLQLMAQHVHYHYIWIGSEHVYEDDVLRLKPEADEKYYLRVASIYKHPEKGIQFTGDLYTRGQALRNVPETVDDYSWVPCNSEEEEFTIDLCDVAGRFYATWPDIEGLSKARELLRVHVRHESLGCDWKQNGFAGENAATTGRAAKRGTILKLPGENLTRKHRRVEKTGANKSYRRDEGNGSGSTAAQPAVTRPITTQPTGTPPTATQSPDRSITTQPITTQIATPSTSTNAAATIQAN